MKSIKKISLSPIFGSLNQLKYVVSLAYLLVVISSNAQYFEWAKSFGGATNFDIGHSVTIDSLGNVYTTGYFQGTVDFDPGIGTFNITSVNTYDVFVQKLDASGNFLWAKSFGGLNNHFSSNSIKIDTSGNVCTTGYFIGTVDFDPGPGTYNLTSMGNRDFFIHKMDASGNFLWAKSIGNVSVDEGKSISIDPLGNLYTTGSFVGTVDFDPGLGINNLTSVGAADVFILKLDAAGDFVWAKSFGGTLPESGNSIAIDPSGYIYSTGIFRGTVDFDPSAGTDIHTSVGEDDVYIQKLDTSGNFLWTKCIGGIDFEDGYAISADASGNVYMIGNFYDTVDFDPGLGVTNLISVGDKDIFVLKLDNLGNFIWAKSFGSTGTDEGRSIGVDASGNVYSTGYFTGTADFNPGSGTFNHTTQGAGDIFIQKMNASGNFVWAISYGGTSSDNAYSICVDALGNLFSTGRFSGTADFNPGVGTFNRTSVGGHDIFVQKLSHCMNTFGTDVQTACSTYQWIDGNTYTTSNNTATHILTNATGCDSIVTLNLTIGDNLAPTADIAILPNITAECEITVLTSPTATDNCAGSIIGTHNLTLPFTTQGTSTIIWIYDDGNGNLSGQTQNIIIEDITAPVADLATLLNVISECSVTSLTAPTATDNCLGTIAGTHNASLPITTQGTTTVTWTYNDGNGNTTTQNQNVIINDAVAPIADVATLSNVTSECPILSLTAPTATDNCLGTIVGTHNASLPITTQGTTTVTWTYDDGNGNISTQNQDVIINDVVAPIADVTTLSNVTSECSILSLTAPTATDNCLGTIAGTHNASLPITSIGTTVVTWTFSDGNGNTTSQFQNVIITPIDDGITQIDEFTLSADAIGYNYQWLDCDNGNTPVSGATNQSFTPFTAGNYACEVSNVNCSVITQCLTSTVGINENEFSNMLVVYPNPSEGTIFIKFNEGHYGVVTRLLDMSGRVVLNKVFNASENVELFFEGQSGFYFLEIEGVTGQKAVVKIEKL